MKLIKGTNKGFFGNVLDAARHISCAIKDKEPWYIEWDKTPYNDPLKGPNAWEYYFKNNYLNDTPTSVVGDYTDLNLFEGHNFRETMHAILTKIISFNDKTSDLLNSVRILELADEHTLGVHIRKTDKLIGYQFGEPTSAKPLDVNVYIKYIDEILPRFTKLFIASDDSDDLHVIKEHVIKKHNKPVTLIDAFRSKGSISIHNNYPEISGYRKGLEVLVDCWTLSRCGHIIRSTSNVGSAAQFINLNLTHTNINQIELGDDREKEYNL